jgi:hypothetical protein
MVHIRGTRVVSGWYAILPFFSEVFSRHHER